MVVSTLLAPDVVIERNSNALIEARIESKRLGPGNIVHTLSLDASRDGAPLWTKEVTFEVDAPFDVPELKNEDPFLIASLFLALETGGVLRFHGTVSRSLLRNALDYQSAWFLAAKQLYAPFTLEVDAVDDRPPVDPGPHPRAILAFTAGLDSLLALCRNASGDAGPTRHDIGATLAIHGMGIGMNKEADTESVIEDLREISAGWNIPLAVVKTNLPDMVGHKDLSHGTWLGACLSLFAGRFDVGLLGSSIVSYWPGWEVFGSHPLLDPLLSGSQMSIRNDEGLFQRVDKTAMLAKYPSAMEDLRVCNHPYDADRNCCRCEKCIRTMLCFIASGNPIPPAFPDGLQLRDIGIGMGRRDGLDWGPVIFEAAKRYGTLDEEAIRVLRRRYRTKRVKVVTKSWVKRLMGGPPPHRWKVFDAG